MPRDLTFTSDLDSLNARFRDDPMGALHYAFKDSGLRIALVSSFGADSAVLLHMAAQIDRDVPVLLLDTLLLFPETLAYQQQLGAHLGLRNIRRIRPEPTALRTHDPASDLYREQPDACCALRKTEPLAQALDGYDGWINGRKRFQTGQRTGLEVFERDPTSGRLKINPLAGFSAGEISAYLDRFALPRHPLVARGYRSIGCAPCTSPVADGEDPRAGRWRGTDKAECGIHFMNGQALRTAS